MQNKRRTGFISILIIILCLSVCIGATYAYFTDSVKSEGNIIKSGKLDVTMEWLEGTKSPTDASITWNDASTGAIFKYELWEPGYTEVRHIRIKNVGTLAFQYKLVIVANGEVSELADVIDVYYFDPAAQIDERSDLIDGKKIGTLTQALAGMDQTATGNLKASESVTITIALKMQENADNKYQDLSIGSDFSIQLHATQYTHESDAFDDQYDAGATFPVETTTPPDPEPTDPSIFYWDVYDDHAVVTGLIWDATIPENLVIPSTYKGLPVTAIGERAFAWNETISTITIPDSVITIGNYAFFLCSNLTSVALGNGVTTIGWQAFSNCYNLTSIEIPNNVTTIDGSAFSWCSNLTSIALGNKVTTIGEEAFAYCPDLTNITVSAENTKYCSIDNCLIEKESNTLISGCKNSIIPNSVTTIGDSAFSGCSNLTSIEIPNSVTTIGDSAFSGCSNLTTIEIPNSVTTIGDVAFADCSNLQNISIPDGIVHVGTNVFSSCSNLKYHKYDNAYYLGNESNPYMVLLKAIDTSIRSCDINKNVKFICDYAFYNCTDLTSIEIPNSVTIIGGWAFYYCTGLTSIKIPNSVTTIDSYAFGNCTSLTSIEIPNSVTTIGSSAFSSCSNLTSVTFGNGVTTIGDMAFDYCTSLTIMEIPNSVTTIGYAAFSSCFNLTSVTIPDSVTTINYYAFGNCTNLTKVTFENPQGWWCIESEDDTTRTDLIEADLQNDETAAEYLKSTYLTYDWYKAE